MMKYFGENVYSGKNEGLTNMRHSGRESGHHYALRVLALWGPLSPSSFDHDDDDAGFAHIHTCLGDNLGWGHLRGHKFTTKDPRNPCY